MMILQDPVPPERPLIRRATHTPREEGVGVGENHVGRRSVRAVIEHIDEGGSNAIIRDVDPFRNLER